MYDRFFISLLTVFGQHTVQDVTFITLVIDGFQTGITHLVSALLAFEILYAGLRLALIHLSIEKISNCFSDEKHFLFLSRIPFYQNIGTKFNPST